MLKNFIKAIIVTGIAIFALIAMFYISNKIYEYTHLENPIVAQKKSTNNLSPIEAGYLIDEQDLKRRAAFIEQNNASFFSNPSEWSGTVKITSVISSYDPQKEYIVIKAKDTLKKPVVISGWSLQSMKTGIRIPLPDAVEDLKLNDVNKTYAIHLIPNQTAIINTGTSPVGVSFVENICTGYLNAFLNFHPPVKLSCPGPVDFIKNENISDECRFFARKLPTCVYLSDKILQNNDVPKQCIPKLKPIFTYSFCREKFKNSNLFFKDADWRIFLNQKTSLWKNSDTIRLLDQYGRIVDVYEY